MINVHVCNCLCSHMLQKNSFCQALEFKKLSINHSIDSEDEPIVFKS